MNLLNPPVVSLMVADERGHKWAEGHGSNCATYLGGGILYYTLAYMLKANVCVCLGSGGGFVPRLMAQAQRDLQGLGLISSLRSITKTILVDADIGEWGRPNWLDKNSNFRRAFPEIEIMFRLTVDAAKAFAANGTLIDYLHIDADHSKAGCLADLNSYLSLMNPDGIMTLHDSAPQRRQVSPNLGVMEAVEEAKREWNLETVNFESIGTGTMILKNRGKR